MDKPMGTEICNVQIRLYKDNIITYLSFNELVCVGSSSIILIFPSYSSDPISQQCHGKVTAHKPEKNYIIRTVISTIGTPRYGSF